MEKFQIISDNIIISDPCYVYNKENRTSLRLKVEKGNWLAKTQIIDNHVKSLLIVHENYEHYISNISLLDNNEKYTKKLIGNCPVDSGQLGFFDENFYRNDELAKDLLKSDFGPDYDEKNGDSWYRSCCYMTTDTLWGVVGDYGVVSSSGYGDGYYEIYSMKDDFDDCVLLYAVFIRDENEEIEEEEW
jgi:hypothetical protein